MWLSLAYVLCPSAAQEREEAPAIPRGDEGFQCAPDRIRTGVWGSPEGCPDPWPLNDKSAERRLRERADTSPRNNTQGVAYQEGVEAGFPGRAP